MKSDTEAILKQFDPIIAQYQAVRSTIENGHDGGGYIRDEASAKKFQTMSMACISRLVGENSSYGRAAASALNQRYTNVLAECEHLYGVLEGLRADVAAGHLSTLKELIHADLFSDLLETAQYFLNEGHKDPAAVMVGGVLESHLRQLCPKHSVDTERTLPDGSKKPKMGEGMNSDPAVAGAYGKMDQKQVTAWLDLRNEAAHGHYDKYDAMRVLLFLQGVRDFIIRYPA